MEEFKDENIHIRISTREKMEILDYVKRKKIKLSDFIRETCLAEIRKDTNV